jgi:hypothetical protein
MFNEKYRHYEHSEICSIAYKRYYDASSLKEQCESIAIPYIGQVYPDPVKSINPTNIITPFGSISSFGYIGKRVIPIYRSKHFEDIKRTKNDIESSICPVRDHLPRAPAILNILSTSTSTRCINSLKKIKNVEDCIAMIDMHKEMCDQHSSSGHKHERQDEIIRYAFEKIVNVTLPIIVDFSEIIICAALSSIFGCSYSSVNNKQSVLDRRCNTDKINVLVVLCGRLPIELAEIIADDSVTAPGTNYVIDTLIGTSVSALVLVPCVKLYRWWNAEESQEDVESNTLIGSTASAPIVSAEAHEGL